MQLKKRAYAVKICMHIVTTLDMTVSDVNIGFLKPIVA